MKATATRRRYPVNMTSTADLLDMAQVAQLLGVQIKTVRMHKHRGTMPPPDATFGRSPVWKRETIETWDATRRTNESARKGPTEETA